MDGFRVENFRCFKDSGLVDLQPLTVLLGVNSSGKSSFLRSLLLLRQSYETKTKSPLLWYGNNVDFGSFQNCLSTFAQGGSIKFHFRSKIEGGSLPYLSSKFPKHVDSAIPYDACIEVSNDEDIDDDEENVYVSKIIISLYDHRIELSFDDRSLLSITINRTSITDYYLKSLFPYRQNGLIPDLFVVQKQSSRYNYEYCLFSKIAPIVRLYAHGRTGNYTLLQILKKIRIGPSTAMLLDMKENQEATITFSNNASNWSIKNSSFTYLRDYIILSGLPNLLTLINWDIERFVKSTLSISPLRAPAERYYRFQDLAVSELDSSGRNLAFYINDLSFTERESFTKWCESNFGFSVAAHTEGGHISITLENQNEEFETNLVDRGFGYSQLIPIMVQLWGIIFRDPERSRKRGPTQKTFIIEQPELHLHPGLQRKLIDVLLGSIEQANSKDIRLCIIVETHSETLVNRIGESIEKQYFQKENAQVLLFDRESELEPTTIRSSGFNAAGHLIDWPYGFFH